MKSKWSKLVSWLLVACMLMSTIPCGLAEQETDKDETLSVTYQTVRLSSDVESLSPDENAYYVQVAENLINDTSSDSYSVESNDDTVRVYSLVNDQGENVILQELIYSDSDDASVSLSSYSEIAVSLKADAAEATEDVVDATDATEDVVDATDATEDAVDATDTTEDVVDATDATEDVVDATDATEDAVDATDTTGDVVDTADATENAVDATDTTGDVVDTADATEDAVDATDTTGDVVDTADATEDVVDATDATVDVVDATDATEDAVDATDATEDDADVVIASTSGEVVTNEIDGEVEANNTTNLIDDDESHVTLLVSATETELAFEDDDVSADSIVDDKAGSMTGIEAESAIAAEAEMIEGTSDTNTFQSEYENEYKTTSQTIITAERLLSMVQENDEFAIEFASKLGFGRTMNEIASNLQVIVDEYHSEIDKGNNFEEPRFVINGVDIVLNKTVEEISLVKNDDGTYSVSLNGTETGYRTSVMIDADASVTIVYDEKGEAKIERKVASGKPTDFVITLDVSGSMEWDGRDNAMFSALKVVLDEILQVEENTVSIVFWANNGAAMQIQVDNNGVSQVFSGADGLTATKVFDASLVDLYGNVSSYSLSDVTIDQIESLYRTGGGTQPDQGLAKAIDLLKNISTDDGRNVGVMLFTDGEANWYNNEHATIAYEKEIAEKYGATIVNVSIGDEYDVRNYERYLDPSSSRYYEKDDQVLKDHVLYYNIPKLSNQELADRVSEMFEIAFEDIMTETKALQTETITDGILAAYGAQLIETIPSGFELVELRGDDNSISYEVNGIDVNGNTTITFKLDDIVSGKDNVISYCVIPTSSGNGIGVTTYTEQSETVLHAKPIDRITATEGNKEVTITVTKANSETPSRPDITDIPTSDHQHIFSVKTEVKEYYSEYDSTYHYVSKVEYQLSCIICGEKGDIVTTTTSKNNHGLLEEHQIRNGRCVRCGYVGEDSGIVAEEKHYYERLINAINGNQNPMSNPQIVDTLKKRLKAGGMTDEEVTKTIDTLRNAPTKYRDLFLLGLYNYDFQINGKNGTYYSWPWNDNAVEMKPLSAQNFINTLFHESGHAIELNLWYIHGDIASTVAYGIDDIEEKIQTALFDDVKNMIRSTITTEYGNSVSSDDVERIVEALVNGNQQETGWFGIRKADQSIQSDSRLSKIYEKVRDTIEDSMKNIPYNNGSMVSDVYGGVTNNKIYGGNGHHDSSDYWYSGDDPTYYQLFEAWAEFYSAKIQGDTFNINKNAEYFPTATELLDDLADALYNYYYEYYSETFQPYKHDLDGLKIA